MAFTRKRKAGGLLLPVLIAVMILGGITPVSAFTAALNTPTDIQPGDLISITLGGLADGDNFEVDISSGNLVNTENSYTLENFYMPFGFQHGTSSLIAEGTNVKVLNMHVKTATDEVTYTKTGGPSLTVSSNEDVHKEVYTIIGFSGTPSTSGSPVGVTLVAQGKVSGTELPDPGKPANLNFTLQGASSGNIRVQVPGATPPLDATFTVTTPEHFVASATRQTPAVTKGSPATLDLTTQTDTSLDITPNTDIPAGSSVTVTQYSSPPSGSGTPSGSVYKALGKYVTIESADLSGKISSMTITIYYTDAERAAAGIAEADMRVFSYNPATGAWEPLDGGVDTTQKKVWGTTTHLSVYGILAVIPQPHSPGGGGGGGGGVPFQMPETMVAPYKGAVATVTKPVLTPEATPVPVAKGTTAEVMTTAVTESPAITTTTPSETPLTPLPGVLGLIIAAGIFFALRRD